MVLALDRTRQARTGEMILYMAEKARETSRGWLKVAETRTVLLCESLHLDVKQAEAGWMVRFEPVTQCLRS